MAKRMTVRLSDEDERDIETLRRDVESALHVDLTDNAIISRALRMSAANARIVNPTVDKPAKARRAAK